MLNPKLLQLLRPKNNEDKAAWIVYGNAMQKIFVLAAKHFGGLDLDLTTLGVKSDTPGYDKYGADLRGITTSVRKRMKLPPVDGELKTEAVPFFTANHFCSQLDPGYSVAINKGALERYLEEFGKNYPVIFWVEWEQLEGYGVEVAPLNGVYLATTALINECKSPPKPLKNRPKNGSSNYSEDKNSTYVYYCDVRILEKRGRKLGCLPMISQPDLRLGNLVWKQNGQVRDGVPDFVSDFI